jgi:hypothetical protein
MRPAASPDECNIAVQGTYIEPRQAFKQNIILANRK